MLPTIGLVLIYHGCIGDARRLSQGDLLQTPRVLPTSRFAHLARRAMRQSPPQLKQRPVMQHSRQFASKLVTDRLTKLNAANRPRVSALAAGKVVEATNVTRSGVVPSVAQKLLAQHFESLAMYIGSSWQMAHINNAMPEHGAEARSLFHMNVAHTCLDKLFGSLRASGDEQALPRVFVSQLGMVGLSVGEDSMLGEEVTAGVDSMKEGHVFAIVKFDTGKYQLLQGYGTLKTTGTSATTVSTLREWLKSHIPGGKMFGEKDLDGFQFALRAFVEKGAQADSSIHSITFTSMEMKGTRLHREELDTARLAKIHREEQDAETLVTKMWSLSRMVAVTGV